MGRFVSPPWLTVIGYVVAVTITGLNANLLISLAANR